MRKFYEEVVLLEQAFVIDPDHRVKEAIEPAGQGRWAAPIVVTGFVRLALGEGLAPKPSTTSRPRWRSWPAPELRACDRIAVLAALNVALTARGARG